MMTLLFRCSIHMEGWKDILYTYNYDMVLSKNPAYTSQGFYFIVMHFFELVHDVQSNGSLPCEGSFAHTHTNTFFKECHTHCLKWVLKGFLSQGILHPLFSRHVLLFLMNYCKVILRFYTSLRIQSTASTQGLGDLLIEIHFF